MQQKSYATPDTRELLSSITSKGQVTIPAEVRRSLGLRPKEKVAFVVNTDGTVRLAAPKYPTLESLFGSVGKLAKPLSFKEMKAIAYEDRLQAKKARQPTLP